MHTHTHTPYFIYPFISFWAPLLILQFSYCEQRCNKHVYTSISFVCWLTLLWMYARVVWWGHKVYLFLVFEELLLYWFPRGCTSSHSHQQCMSVPFLPRSLPAFVVCFLDDCWSDSSDLYAFSFLFGDTELELKASCLQSRCFSLGATPLVLFGLVILKMGSC
jgi:hypothetical protein